MERRVEGIGDSPNADCGRAQNAPPHSAEVGSLEAAFGTQALLRDARLSADFSHNGANSLSLQVRGLDLASVPLHLETSWWYFEADANGLYALFQGKERENRHAEGA
jgi:hypothetical protein